MKAATHETSRSSRPAGTRARRRAWSRRTPSVGRFGPLEVGGALGPVEDVVGRDVHEVRSCSARGSRDVRRPRGVDRPRESGSVSARSTAVYAARWTTTSGLAARHALDGALVLDREVGVRTEATSNPRARPAAAEQRGRRPADWDAALERVDDVSAQLSGCPGHKDPHQPALPTPLRRSARGLAAAPTTSGSRHTTPPCSRCRPRRRSTASTRAQFGSSRCRAGSGGRGQDGRGRSS